ncbi:hypothetical protein [Novosphingobium terrae]|uniref:hypothetical protein n=1 Tax=Novosphingobium terrae TaxID=2726189 RepID=UPI0019813DA7|nr:hypothetical protein [Novosphingobium terrae]
MSRPAPPLYKTPHLTPARVQVSRDHLQDYLTLRGMVQVYMELHSGPVDHVIEAALGDETHLDLVFKDRSMSLRRGRRDGYDVEVRGAHILARPGPLPITGDTLNTDGLAWPGLPLPLTNQHARQLSVGDDMVYVRDAVLAAYEGRPDFEISPERAGVACGAQRSVDYVTRIGRDLLQLEARKLYEGAPERTIRHWHSFAVEPPAPQDLATMRAQPNVATRAKDLTDALTALGQQLVRLARALDIDDLEAVDFIGMDPAQRQWSGWWNAPFVEAITRHIPTDMTQADLLQRCLELDKVAIEALGERALRRLVNAIGKQSDTNKFRRLKLLDRLLCLADLANITGQHLAGARTDILDRFNEDGARSNQPVRWLFALSDLPQVATHRKTPNTIPDTLERLNLDPKATKSGWGTTLDSIYDAAIMDLRHACVILDQALGS